MKKFLVGIALVSLAGLANAQSAFEGLFGQVGIGYESTNPNFSSGTTGGSSYTMTNVGNSKGFGGALSIGSYFGVTNTFLLGVGAEYSPLATSNSNYTINISGSGSEVQNFKKKNSYNIFLSPALVIDKSKLAYAKVGYTGMSAQTTDGDGLKDNYSFSGYSLGLGYKQIIDGGIYGFLEGNYSAYGSKTLTDTTGNLKPKTMNLLVGVGYKF